MTMRCLRIGGSNGGLKVMDESGPLGLGSWVGGGDDPLAGWALMRGEEVGSDSVDDGAVELGEWRSPRG